MNRFLSALVGIVGVVMALPAAPSAVTVSNFRFVLEGCKQAEAQVVCRLNVTNTNAYKRDLGLYRPLNAQDSATFGEIYGADGIPHRLSGAGFGKLGGEVLLSLPPSIPTRLEVAYPVRLEGKEIPLLHFSTSVGKVEFKKITLQ